MFRGLGLRQTVYGNNDYESPSVDSGKMYIPKKTPRPSIPKPTPIIPPRTRAIVPTPQVEAALTEPIVLENEEEEKNGLGFDFLNKLYQKNKQNNQLNKQNNQYGLYKNKYDEQYSEPVFDELM